MQHSQRDVSAHSPLTDKTALLALARRFGVRPSKKHSQNFILDDEALSVMVEAAELQKGDHVVEVGAGFGALTEKLLAAHADVLACEIDEKLCAALHEKFHAQVGFHLVPGDFFQWYRRAAQELSPKPFSLIANLPYHATSFFFQTVLAGNIQPKQIVVMLQKEVAERIAARPGTMSLLALSVQLFGDAHVLATVPRTAFWPEPDVDSAILHVERIHHGDELTAHVLQYAKMCFSNKRKQLHNSLGAGLHRTSEDATALLVSAAIDRSARPQDLSLADWHRLALAAGRVSGSNGAAKNAN